MASLRWLRGIMERDVSDWLVSGTKCTEEFLVAITMTLSLQVVLEFPAEFYEHGTVKGARWRRDACLFQSQQRSKVRLEATSPVEERGRGIGLLQPPVFYSPAVA